MLEGSAGILPALGPQRPLADPGTAEAGAASVVPDLYDRVHDLLERNAVALVVGWERRAAVVNGLHGWYLVKALRSGVACDCEAGRSGATCSHALAAMVVWAEL